MAYLGPEIIQGNVLNIISSNSNDAIRQGVCTS